MTDLKERLEKIRAALEAEVLWLSGEDRAGILAMFAERDAPEKENRVLAELRRDFITLQKRIVGETGLSAIETIDKTLKHFDAKYLAEIFEIDQEPRP